MAEDRDKGEAAALPEPVWDGCEYTSVHAAILFADVENSVMISSTLPEAEYDQLVQSFQASMIELIDSLKEQGLPVAEYSVVGDQLCIFFYEPEEVARNYSLDGPGKLEGDERAEMIAQCKSCNENLALAAFKAALQLKNLWLVQVMNLRGVLNFRNPLGLGIGIHYGRVYLRNRPDGQCRIEGYTIGFAKRIETSSRQGLYSHVMCSQETRDIVRGSVIKHTQLRQRIFFHKHLLPPAALKGVGHAENIYELKFYHRIGVPLPDQAFEHYKAIFAVDRSNVWAYYQLFDYYVHKQRDWEAAFELAKIACVVHPQDEKVLLDLAKCYFQLGNLEQSRQYAEQALRLNEQFDLVHEHLALIANKTDDLEAQVRHWRNAARLSPDSPINNLNLGLALLEDDQADAGVFHIGEALRVYPEMEQWPHFAEALENMDEKGKLPEALQGYLTRGASAAT